MHPRRVVELCCLLCREENVFVVGENYDILGIVLAELCDKLLGRGVRGLAAGDYSVSTHIGKERSNSLAGRNRESHELLLDRVLLLGLLARLGMAERHILYLHSEEFAERPALVKHHTGVEGVNVNLDDIALLVGDDALTAQLLEQQNHARNLKGIGVNLRRRQTEKKLGAVSEFKLAVTREEVDVNATLRGRGIEAVGINLNLAGQSVIHTERNAEIARTAGVNDVGLGEHRQNLLCPLERALRLLDVVLIEILDRGLLVYPRRRVFCALAEDGEYRALGGIHNRGIGLLYTAPVGLDEVESGNLFILFERGLDSCENLR